MYSHSSDQSGGGMPHMSTGHMGSHNSAMKKALSNRKHGKIDMAIMIGHGGKDEEGNEHEKMESPEMERQENRGDLAPSVEDTHGGSNDESTKTFHGDDGDQMSNDHENADLDRQIYQKGQLPKEHQAMGGEKVMNELLGMDGKVNESKGLRGKVQAKIKAMRSKHASGIHDGVEHSKSEENA